MQGLPQDKRIAGFLLAIGLTQVAVPLARAISPLLLADGDITNLFVLQFALSLVAVGLVNILHLPPGDTIRSFEKLDLVTFPLLASGVGLLRSEEHTSELQSLMRISYAVFCLKKKK